MAKKNRKRRMHAAVLPAPFIGLAGLAVSLLIGYLWLDNMCGALGQQIRKLEEQYESLEGECRRERDRWTAMKGPEQIDLALQRHGLHMTLPHGGQVVRTSTLPSYGDYRSFDQYASRR